MFSEVMFHEEQERALCESIFTAFDCGERIRSFSLDLIPVERWCEQDLTEQVQRGI
jgi:hypothetical protein